MTATPRRRATTFAALLSLALVALGVARVSEAGFSDTTSNDANAWSTGTVNLTDDDQGAAMFTVGGDDLLSGGQSLTRCINVTYSGTLTADRAVRLYATATGALAPYLNLTVVEGADAAQGSCSGFTPTSTLYTGTVAGFAAMHDTFAHGASDWAITTAPETRSYQFTVTVQNTVGAMAKSGGATFTWEAAPPVAPDPLLGLSVAHAKRLDAATAPGTTNLAVLDFNTAAPFEQWEKDAGLFWGGQDYRLWYQFTPAITGLLELNTFPGTDLADAACKTILSPVVGTEPNLSFMNYGADGYGGYDFSAGNTLDPDQTCAGQSQIVMKVTAGATYRMFAQPGTLADRTKKALLRIRPLDKDPNDNIADALTIPALGVGESTVLKFNAFGAGSEPGEPDPTVDGTPGATLWFRYTAPRSQTLTIDTDQYENRYTKVRVFSGGPAFNTLTEVGSIDHGTVGTVTLNAGQTYYLQTRTRDWQAWDYFTITSN